MRASIRQADALFFAPHRRQSSVLERKTQVNAPLTPPIGSGPSRRGPVPDPRPLKLQIFEHVRAMGRTARADCARALGISPGSATLLTAELIEAGLLREARDPPRATGRGRPRAPLEVVGSAAHVIGIKIGADRLSAVLADLTGTPVAEAQRATPPGRRDTADVLNDIAALTGSLPRPGPILGLGLGLAGMVDHAAGTVAWSPLLADQDVALGPAVAGRLGLPTWIDNDANLLTLAELWFGAGRETADFAVVTVEEGVGMGLVLGSELFRGSRGMGLELGHTKVALGGALCRCGRRGCLEAYLADYALAREAATALGLEADSDTLLEALSVAARAGDRAASEVFERASRHLALGLSNLVQLFDPPLIILSGERMRTDDLWSDAVLREMSRLSLIEGRAPPRIEPHRWDDSVWARGASALALSAATPGLVTS